MTWFAALLLSAVAGGVSLCVRQYACERANRSDREAAQQAVRLALRSEYAAVKREAAAIWADPARWAREERRYAWLVREMDEARWMTGVL